MKSTRQVRILIKTLDDEKGVSCDIACIAQALHVGEMKREAYDTNTNHRKMAVKPRYYTTIHSVDGHKTLFPLAAFFSIASFNLVTEPRSHLLLLNGNKDWGKK